MSLTYTLPSMNPIETINVPTNMSINVTKAHN